MPIVFAILCRPSLMGEIWYLQMCHSDVTNRRPSRRSAYMYIALLGEEDEETYLVECAEA